MWDIITTRRFEKDWKRLKKRGKNFNSAKLQVVLEALRTEGRPPASTRPHRLVNDWAGMWECHIAPDWLLIFDSKEGCIVLLSTGTHSDLFK